MKNERRNEKNKYQYKKNKIRNDFGKVFTNFTQKKWIFWLYLQLHFANTHKK